MAYSEKVIDHYENPRNVGSMDKDETSVGTGMVGAPACGDVMRLQIKVTDDGVIEDAKFKTYGCGSAIASSSLLTEWVKGKPLDEAGQIKNTEIADELKLPPVKIHCSVLAEDAIKAAIDDYRRTLDLVPDHDVALNNLAYLLAGHQERLSEALAYAHRQGTLHRDVKPSNIMLARQGAAYDVVKVVDFGLVKRLLHINVGVFSNDTITF